MFSWAIRFFLRLIVFSRDLHFARTIWWQRSKLYSHCHSTDLSVPLFVHGMTTVIICLSYGSVVFNNGCTSCSCSAFAVNWALYAEFPHDVFVHVYSSLRYILHFLTEKSTKHQISMIEMRPILLATMEYKPFWDHHHHRNCFFHTKWDRWLSSFNSEDFQRSRSAWTSWCIGMKKEFCPEINIGHWRSFVF